MLDHPIWTSTAHHIRHHPLWQSTSPPLRQWTSRTRPIAGRRLLTLLPSWLAQRLAPDLFPPHPAVLRATSYLDGLRGIASLTVVLGHYTMWAVPEYKAYGNQGDAAAVSSNPLQWPFVRVLWAAHPAVHVFFVISGYVLAVRPLRAARGGDTAGVCETLSSGVFRRGIRLFVPMLASTFALVPLYWLGWASEPVVAGTMFPHAGLWDYVRDWAAVTWWKMAHVWVWDPVEYPRYDGHTWTIMIEMGMSLLLFVVLLGLCRCRVPVRIALLAGIAWWCFGVGHWAAAEFLGGAVFAEAGLIQDSYAAAAKQDEEVWRGDIESTQHEALLSYASSSSLRSTDANTYVVALNYDEKSEGNTQSPALSSASTAIFDETDMSRLVDLPKPEILGVERRRSKRFLSSNARNSMARAWICFCWMQFVFALYVCGWPDEGVTEVWGLRYVDIVKISPSISSTGDQHRRYCLDPESRRLTYRVATWNGIRLGHTKNGNPR